MTTSISEGRIGTRGVRRAAALAAVCLLSACAGVIDVGRSAPRSVAVTGDDVVISGPPGFCVDTGASREVADGAFVLLGSCAAISNNPRQPAPGTPGVLTVTVSGDVGPGDALGPLLGNMAAFIRTEDGRAALSRTGDAGTVTILDTRVRDGMLYIHARDTASGRKGMATDYWRALFGVKDRLLTVSVTGFEDAPLPGEAGLGVLDTFAARIRAANGA